MKKLAAILLIASMIAGCGGGKDEGDSTNVTLSNQSIIDYALSASDWYSMMFSGRGYDASGIRRYSANPSSNIVPIRMYVPTATTTREADLRQKVLNSVDLVNKKLAGLVSISITDAQISTQDSNVLAMSQFYKTDPNSQGFWRIGYDTAQLWDPAKPNYNCANVSDGPFITSTAFSFSENPQWIFTDNPINRSVKWINLGNGKCDVSQDTVIHELAHALGILVHFDGYGNGPAISEGMWAVLLTMYKNPIGTKRENIIVYRN